MEVKCRRYIDLLSFGEASGMHMLWMEEVKAELGERANLVSKFVITEENTKKEIAK